MVNTYGAPDWSNQSINYSYPIKLSYTVTAIATTALSASFTGTYTSALPSGLWSKAFAVAPFAVNSTMTITVNGNITTSTSGIFVGVMVLVPSTQAITSVSVSLSTAATATWYMGIADLVYFNVFTSNGVMTIASLTGRQINTIASNMYMGNVNGTANTPVFDKSGLIQIGTFTNTINVITYASPLVDLSAIGFPDYINTKTWAYSNTTNAGFNIIQNLGFIETSILLIPPINITVV